MPRFWGYLKYLDRHPSVHTVARWYFQIEKDDQPAQKPTRAQLLALAGRR